MNRDWQRLRRLEDLLTPDLNRMLLGRATDQELQHLADALERDELEAEGIWWSLQPILANRRVRVVRRS